MPDEGSPACSPGASAFTIDRPAEFELTVRRSRFIGVAAPLACDQEAPALLEQARDRWPRATHYPYAYRVGVPPQHQKMSDDREPAGTAGRPILGALERSRLTHVCVVVVRYFGGVRLGAGPLARAYGEAAQGALQAAGRVELVPVERFRVRIAYDRIAILAQSLEAAGGLWRPVAYEQEVEGELDLPSTLGRPQRGAILSLFGQVAPAGSAYARRRAPSA